MEVLLPNSCRGMIDIDDDGASLIEMMMGS
jgi:hypothetical protein